MAGFCQGKRSSVGEKSDPPPPPPLAPQKRKSRAGSSSNDPPQPTATVRKDSDRTSLVQHSKGRHKESEPLASIQSVTAAAAAGVPTGAGKLLSDGAAVSSTTATHPEGPSHVRSDWEAIRSHHSTVSSFAPSSLIPGGTQPHELDSDRSGTSSVDRVTPVTSTPGPSPPPPSVVEKDTTPSSPSARASPSHRNGSPSHSGTGKSTNAVLPLESSHAAKGRKRPLEQSNSGVGGGGGPSSSETLPLSSSHHGEDSVPEMPLPLPYVPFTPSNQNGEPSAPSVHGLDSSSISSLIMGSAKKSSKSASPRQQQLSNARRTFTPRLEDVTAVEMPALLTSPPSTGTATATPSLCSHTFGYPTTAVVARSVAAQKPPDAAEWSVSRISEAANQREPLPHAPKIVEASRPPMPKFCRRSPSPLLADSTVSPAPSEMPAPSHTHAPKYSIDGGNFTSAPSALLAVSVASSDAIAAPLIVTATRRAAEKAETLPDVQASKEPVTTSPLMLPEDDPILMSSGPHTLSHNVAPVQHPTTSALTPLPRAPPAQVPVVIDEHVATTLQRKGAMLSTTFGQRTTSRKASEASSLSNESAGGSSHTRLPPTHSFLGMPAERSTVGGASSPASGGTNSRTTSRHGPHDNTAMTGGRLDLLGPDAEASLSVGRCSTVDFFHPIGSRFSTGSFDVASTIATPPSRSLGQGTHHSGEPIAPSPANQEATAHSRTQSGGASVTFSRHPTDRMAASGGAGGLGYAGLSVGSFGLPSRQASFSRSATPRPVVTFSPDTESLAGAEDISTSLALPGANKSSILQRASSGRSALSSNAGGDRPSGGSFRLSVGGYRKSVHQEEELEQSFQRASALIARMSQARQQRSGSSLGSRSRVSSSVSSIGEYSDTVPLRLEPQDTEPVEAHSLPNSRPTSPGEEANRSFGSLIEEPRSSGGGAGGALLSAAAVTSPTSNVASPRRDFGDSPVPPTSHRLALPRIFSPPVAAADASPRRASLLPMASPLRGSAPMWNSGEAGSPYSGAASRRGSVSGLGNSGAVKARRRSRCDVSFVDDDVNY